jgi:hypothetical protein
MEESRSVLKIVIVKPTGKRLLERSRRTWEDNIRMDLKKIGINTTNYVHSTQGRDFWRALVNAALNFQVPYAMEFFAVVFVMMGWSLLPNALRPF